MMNQHSTHMIGANCDGFIPVRVQNHMQKVKEHHSASLIVADFISPDYGWL